MGAPVLNESIMLSRISKGDKAAFSLVFTAYYTDLVMFAFTFVKVLEVSEEITQDVFVKLWDNRESLEIKTSLKSFLLKSVQNKCIDWLRHKKIKNKYSEDVLNFSVFHENQTEDYILHSELEGVIDKALQELPEKVNQTYILNRFEGFTYSEIAEKMHVSVRTVEVRISKALSFLRKKLKEYT